ncbi:MAG: S26 family signal peptidase [Dehalococcoidia bacterium]
MREAPAYRNRGTGRFCRLLPALAAASVAAFAIRRCLGRFVVRGPSMEPTLRDGDRLLVLRGPASLLRLGPDALVLARTSAVPDREIVKRIAAVRHSPRGPLYLLLGDNPHASTDSRHFGAVPRSSISGRILVRYWPDDRRGRVR